MLDRIEDQPIDDELKDIFVGWPADGGLLVVEYQNDVGEEKVPMDIGKLRMASTMHERCEMLRNRFGAKLYHDWREYDGFAELDNLTYSQFCRELLEHPFLLSHL